MFRGFYTAAAGMMAQNRYSDLLSNNLANVNTPGYKAGQGVIRSFPNMLIDRIDNMNSQNIGELSTGVYMDESVPDFSMGPLRQTTQSTDMALISANIPENEETGRPGALFFSVMNGESEPRYTRNGHFNVDGQGRLVTPSGEQVMDMNGEAIQLNTSDFNVRSDGTVVENGEEVAQIQIAYAADPYQLEKTGSGLFRLNDGADPLPAANGNPDVGFSIKQGFLEESNVSSEQTMTQLMSSYRLFEANQKILKTYDRSMQLAATKVGRLG